MDCANIQNYIYTNCIVVFALFSLCTVFESNAPRYTLYIYIITHYDFIVFGIEFCTLHFALLHWAILYDLVLCRICCITLKMSSAIPVYLLLYHIILYCIILPSMLLI